MCCYGHVLISVFGCYVLRRVVELNVNGDLRGPKPVEEECRGVVVKRGCILPIY